MNHLNFCINYIQKFIVYIIGVDMKSDLCASGDSFAHNSSQMSDFEDLLISNVANWPIYNIGHYGLSGV